IRKTQKARIDRGLKYIQGQEIVYVFDNPQGTTYHMTYILFETTDVMVGNKVPVLFCKELNIIL
ncbi:MAG TPA: hypothetical protein VHL11_00770, partial [Phototrophicaceae bacterium]|nr:hypothetical protein [Phototrophicaceae bacterium]